MTDRPILFSAPMICALLDGRKFQTRRLIDFDGIERVREFVPSGIEISTDRLRFEAKDALGNRVTRPINRCLYDMHYIAPYRPGDRLWVRETWRTSARFDDLSPVAVGRNEGKKSAIMVQYEADDNSGALIPPGRRRASIHLPRWASRITLDVTAVRIERLQAITTEDAIAEGFACVAKDAAFRRGLEPTWKYGIPDRDGFPGTDDHGWPWDEWEVDPRAAYARLWDKINTEEPWNSNPWVIAVDFTVRKGNIDA